MLPRRLYKTFFFQNDGRGNRLSKLQSESGDRYWIQILENGGVSDAAPVQFDPANWRPESLRDASYCPNRCDHFTRGRHSLYLGKYESSTSDQGNS